MAPRCEQTQLAWPSLQGHHGGQSRAGHFRIRCTRWRRFASPGVSGLQKPPAGSGSAGGGGGNGLAGRRLWIWAGASSFHTGDCAMDKAAPLPFPALPGHTALPCFQHPLLEGGTSLQDHPCCTSIPIPTGSWTLFKTYTVIRKNETEKGKKKTKHTTKANSQRQTLSYRVPKKGNDLRDQVPIARVSPSLSSPDSTAGIPFPFAANGLQMDRSSGSLTTPSLKERRKKKERKERRKMASQDCV